MESCRFLFGPPASHDKLLYLRNGDSGFHGSDFADVLKIGGVKMMMSMEDTSRRRPFFSSPDDMFDEDYDEQMPDKKRRLTQDQVILLEKSFEAENKLEPDRKTQLANKLGLQPRQVAVWFQNRRARWKTKQLEREYGVLKSTYDSLLSNFDSVVKENEKLKSEVVSLSEKLEAKEAAGISNPPKKSTTSAIDITPISFNVGITLEDGWSSGTGGSTVVDEDGPQLLDSGDSYFPSNDYTVNDCMHSNEHDRGDDERSCFHDVFAQNHVEVESLCWWDWS